jgi:hypothetical protein
VLAGFMKTSQYRQFQGSTWRLSAGAARAHASFCVALRPQPINATTSLQPIIDFGLALKALDVAKLGAGIVSFDLPLVIGDAVVFEFDSGFAHVAVIAVFGWRDQRDYVSRPGRRHNRSRYDSAIPRERFRLADRRGLYDAAAGSER